VLRMAREKSFTMIQPETKDALSKLTHTARGSVAAASMEYGRIRKEPLFYALDGMLRYAKAYRVRFEGPLAEDYVLGPEWLAVVQGLRGLLNGDGAVAMETGRSSDSKDNGVCEEIFWHAMKAAGFTEEDL
jgi:hypothetical protein